jgi:hypothetical protein
MGGVLVLVPQSPDVQAALRDWLAAWPHGEDLLPALLTPHKQSLKESDAQLRASTSEVLATLLATESIWHALLERSCDEHGEAACSS